MACPDSVQKTYEVMPGDYIARAIPLIAGNHHFYLKYEPPGFAMGKGISFAALPAFLGLWIWFWKKKPRAIEGDANRHSA